MDLAAEYGEPLWCKGTGMRNTHLLAVAPTVSNSVICGGISAGIEPLPANVYTFNGAKGTFIRKNKSLEALLESKGENKDKVVETNVTRRRIRNGVTRYIYYHQKKKKYF